MKHVNKTAFNIFEIPLVQSLRHFSSFCHLPFPLTSPSLIPPNKQAMAINEPTEKECEAWYSELGWHFDENNDFVDKNGKHSQDIFQMIKNTW